MWDDLKVLLVASLAILGTGLLTIQFAEGYNEVKSRFAIACDKAGGMPIHGRFNRLCVKREALLDIR